MAAVGGGNVVQRMGVLVSLVFEAQNLKQSMNKIKRQFAAMKGGLTRMRKAAHKAKQEGKGAQMVYAGWLGTMLSLLFITQGISAALSRMISPVLEILGVTDVWRAMLISVLAPVLIPISKFLIKIMTFFMKLPKPVKFWIGVLIVALFVLATIVGMLVQIGLLIGSIGLMFAGKFGIAAGFAVISKFVMWLWVAFKGIFAWLGGALQGTLGTILGVVMGVIAVVWGAVRIITGFFEGDVWRVVSGVLLAIAGIVLLVLGGWIPALIVGIVALLVWLGDKFVIVRQIILTLLYPLTAIANVIMAIIDALKTWSLEPLKKLNPFKGGLLEGAWGWAKGLVGLQEGGIVTQPTLAMIGESGPEAVVPLSGGAGGPIVNINISGASFNNRAQMMDMVNMIQSALRDELRRLGVR